MAAVPIPFVYSDKYEMEFEGHVFPVEKYRLIKEKLLREGLLKETDIVIPFEITDEDLLLAHDKEYIDDFVEKRWTWRTLYSELPLNETIVEGFILMAGGSYIAADGALRQGAGFNIGGGFHHAFPDHAEGFCYINDIGIAIRKLQREGKIKRACVVDCDLHQGNGTAKIFQNDPSVYTFSIHQENNYPVPKERSDWDIGLDDGVWDEEYLSILEKAVIKIYDSHRPELIIYQAGADPFMDDQLGGLNITKDGLKRRDEIVISYAKKRRIPIAVVLGGGYAHNINDTVDIHCNTAKVLLSKYAKG